MFEQIKFGNWAPRKQIPTVPVFEPSYFEFALRLVTVGKQIRSQLFKDGGRVPVHLVHDKVQIFASSLRPRIATPLSTIALRVVVEKDEELFAGVLNAPVCGRRLQEQSDLSNGHLNSGDLNNGLVWYSGQGISLIIEWSVIGMLI